MHGEARQPDRRANVGEEAGGEASDPARARVPGRPGRVRVRLRRQGDLLARADRERGPGADRERPPRRVRARARVLDRQRGNRHRSRGAARHGLAPGAAAAHRGSREGPGLRDPAGLLGQAPLQAALAAVARPAAEEALAGRRARVARQRATSTRARSTSRSTPTSGERERGRSLSCTRASSSASATRPASARSSSSGAGPRRRASPPR